jgi:Ferritin-like domain
LFRLCFLRIRALRRAVFGRMRTCAYAKQGAEKMHATRRGFIGAAAKLSALAVALLAGRDALAQGEGSPQDLSILNVALGLEWEGINAYTLGAQSGLLQKPVLDIAVRFQNDHKEHAETLAGAIRKMGGKPVQPKALGEYAKALKADTLKSQSDVLDLAARLELGATNAYIGVIPSFRDRGLAQVAARLAADEVMHWTILNNALGRPLPAGGMPFGA